MNMTKYDLDSKNPAKILLQRKTFQSLMETRAIVDSKKPKTLNLAKKLSRNRARNTFLSFEHKKNISHMKTNIRECKANDVRRNINFIF